MANKHTVTAITDNLSQLITNLNQTAKDAGGTDRSVSYTHLRAHET